MKKNGYTLAEALIAMAIVGVIAAIMAPMVNKFKPDTNKVVYLKNYDTITEAISYFANSSSIYPLYNSDEQRENYKRIIYEKYPLYNTVAVNKDGIRLSGGERKFCEILALSFGINPEDASCTNKNIDGNEASFTTKSGVDYIVNTTIQAPNAMRGYFKSEILIDVDGLNKGNNSTYNSNDCKDPDRFKFVVYSDGQLYATDPKGRSYLTKRTTYRKIEDDLEHLAHAGGNTDLERFNLTYAPEEETPGGEGPKMYGFSCMNSYIANDPGYAAGVPIACGGGRIVEMEAEPNPPRNQAEAAQDCASKGLRLPNYYELSAAGLYASQLGLVAGNYWGDGSDGKARVCYLPTGNCGQNNASNKFQYRCVKP